MATTHHQRCNAPIARSRHGFTLVELLIVVSILLILSSLTLVIFNSTEEADRIRSSARQLQSALLGARDRAIQAKVPRGLRLLLQDTTDSSARAAHMVTGLVYIGADQFWSQGIVNPQFPDFSIPSINHTESQANNGVYELLEYVVLRGTNTEWKLLYDQGLIDTGSRIEIPRNSGEWYAIDVSLLVSPPSGAPTGEYLVIPRNGLRTPPTGGSVTYQLELQPTVLAGQEPLRLSSNVVINLDRSSIPPGWYNTSTNPRNYFNGTTGAPLTLDIMFSPRGWAADTAVAPISPSGVLHFYLCSQLDADRNLDPAHVESGHKLILSFFPRTGNVATYEVDVTDVNPADGIADDPLHFAKIGGTAGK